MKKSHRKGQTLEQEYGKNKANEIRKKIGQSHLGKSPWNKGTKGICKSNSGSFQKGMKPWNAGLKGMQTHTEERKEAARKRMLGNKSRTNMPVSLEERKKRQKGMLKHFDEKGRKSPVYRLLRNSMEFREWRKKVFERDDYTCQGCEQKGGKLHPHHMISFTHHPRFRFNPDYGQTLCEPCHYDLHKQFGFNHGGDI